MKISIISCGGSNVTSVANALTKIGHEPELLTAPDRRTDFLIMPGVGAFGTALKRLNETGFADYIKEHVSAGKPTLGICLGMQIMFESSEEDPAAKGLSIFPGHFQKLKQHSSPELRCPPNIGYSLVEFRMRHDESRDDAVLDGYYYFLHSYALKEISAEIDSFGVSNFNDEAMFPFVMRQRVCGVQFHPERSGPRGLKTLSHLIQLLK